MRRIICASLLITIVFGLLACGAESAVTQPQTTSPTTAPASVSTTESSTMGQTESAPVITAFSAGYARIAITPQTAVPLSGSTKARTSTSIHDDLYATAIALSDTEGNSVILLTLDLQSATDNTVRSARPLISAKTGVPENRIMISATHTHSGPAMKKTGDPAIAMYIEYLIPRLVQVCADAMTDRKPAQMYIGHVDTENLNFVKHYENTLEDGTRQFFGDHFGTPVYDDTTKHTTEVYPTMHILQLKRENALDIVLANWRAHPNRNASAMPEAISADYPGSLRLSVETQVDCHFAYFNGACGNLNATTRLSEERRAANMDEHGFLLSQYVVECLNNNMVPIESGTIRTGQRILAQPINHTMDHLAIKAREITSYYNATGDTDGAKAMGAPFGIRSTIHAGCIVTNSKMGETADVELNAIAIGDSFALVTAPNELFDTNSKYVEDNSAFAHTFTVGYANGYRGYVPSAYGWEYTCYESDCSWFLPGTGEHFQNQFLEMLQELQDAG